ncbi:MAG: Hachiman antiphage defense system protein HamA [Candidatus Absconditabacteria bacterium]
MTNELKEIKNHNIDLKKIGDDAYIYFFDKSDSIDNFIKRIDNYLPEVIFTKKDIMEYNSHFDKGFTKITINEHSKDYLKRLKAEYTSINKDYPYKNAGELGEIILTIFQKRHLGAIKVVSKMGNRDSITFNILGRDTSFVYKDGNGKIYMLIGESKLKVNSKKNTNEGDLKYNKDSLKEGLSDAHDDLKIFYDNQMSLNHEINLARKGLKYEMDETDKELLVEYFIKDNPKHSDLIFKNVIFVGYTFENYLNFKSGQISDDEFINEVLLNVQESFNSNKVVLKKNIIDNNTIYFLLPFECIETARKEFVNHYNLENV